MPLHKPCRWSSIPAMKAEPASSPNARKRFLPTTQQDLDARGWDSCDFIIVSGDAYVDHPSFGTALIGRLLESQGYRVGIIAQPDWRNADDFRRLGRPGLAFLVSAGNLDSMVAHYTSTRKPRSRDAYSPGGIPGKRPDRAVITYTMRIRQAYSGIPVIIGGIEASLRRLSHYDYWSDRIRRSILLDAKADLLIYGMAERAITEIAARLRTGAAISTIKDVPGTVTAIQKQQISATSGIITLPPYSALSGRDPQSNLASAAAKRAYVKSVQLRMLHENPMHPEPVIEEYDTRHVVQNPPAKPLSTGELDALYELPFARDYHPDYAAAGGVPALEEVQFSITSNRGCYGSCSFCAITTHQGRIIQSRSHESILNEIRELTTHSAFRGYIHDIGGPTANFQAPACKRQLKHGPCTDKLCLHPQVCSAVRDSHAEYLSLLKKARSISGVRKVFIKSGIRYDYLLSSTDSATRNRFITELASHHVSGQLKVAPEHVSESVLDYMGKPGIAVYERFAALFAAASKQAGKKQYIIPYFISGHPGSTLQDAVELALYLKEAHFIPDQVQDFYPTPGTVATAIYFTGLDPRPDRNFASVHVPRGREKQLQRALLHFHKRENRKLVAEALEKAGRKDLIGRGADCLVSGSSAGGKNISRQKRSRKTSGR